MKTILIVDDETHIRRVYGELLKSRGYKTFSAGNAVDARELLKYIPIDLILLDINLGGLNGEKLADVVQTFHPRTKIIVASVYPVDEQKKIIPKISDYYDKSESLKTLIAKVEDAFKDRPKIDPKKNVLIIDSLENFREDFLNSLNNQFNCVYVEDNLEIFKTLKEKENCFDLILLKEGLNNMDSHELFKIIKSKYPQQRIIVMGKHFVPELKNRIPGADEYFDEFEEDEILIREIQRFLARSDFKRKGGNEK